MSRLAGGMFFVEFRVIHVKRGENIFAADGAQVNTHAQPGNRRGEAVFHFERQRLGRAEAVGDDSARVFDAQAEGAEGGCRRRDIVRFPEPFPGLGLPRGQVEIDRFGGGCAFGQLALLHDNRFLRQAQDGAHVVADEKHRAPFLGDIVHLPQAFALEFGIPNRQDFVDDQDFRFEMGGNGKGQAQVHPRRIALDRGIDKLFDFGKGDNLVEVALDFSALHPEDGAVHVNILAPGQFRVETGPHFEEGPDPSAHGD